MPPKRTAGSDAAPSKRQKSDSAPKSTGWSKVSCTANIYASHVELMSKEPEGPYSFRCMCRPPFSDDNYSNEDSDYEDTDESLSEGENENEKSDKGPEPTKTNCDGGKTCLCKDPAEQHPEHPWIFTRAGVSRFFDQRLCADLRCPDMFDMYTYNDHHGYGLM